MNPPNQWEILKAWAMYRGYRLRVWWRLVTFRCPSCPKRLRGPHKFSCPRNGGGQLRFNMVRRES